MPKMSNKTIEHALDELDKEFETRKRALALAVFESRVLPFLRERQFAFTSDRDGWQIGTKIENLVAGSIAGPTQFWANDQELREIIDVLSIQIDSDGHGLGTLMPCREFSEGRWSRA